MRAFVEIRCVDCSGEFYRLSPLPSCGKLTFIEILLIILFTRKYNRRIISRQLREIFIISTVYGCWQSAQLNRRNFIVMERKIAVCQIFFDKLFALFADPSLFVLFEVRNSLLVFPDF